MDNIKGNEHAMKLMMNDGDMGDDGLKLSMKKMNAKGMDMKAMNKMKNGVTI